MTERAVTHHVGGFMMSVDPDRGMSRIGEMIARAVTEDPAAAAGAAAIKRWLAEPLLDEDTSNLYERVRGPVPTPDPLGGPSGLSTVLAAAHARARDVLAASPGKFTYEKVKSRLADAESAIARIEPEFVGEVLLEAENRRRYDERYNAAINHEIDSLRDLAARSERLAPVLAGDDDTRAAAATARASSLSCRINGQPAPCGLVVVIIVIVIVVGGKD